MLYCARKNIDPSRASEASEIVTDSEGLISSTPDKNCPTCRAAYLDFLISLEQLKKIQTVAFHLVLTVTKTYISYHFPAQLFILSFNQFSNQLDTGYWFVCFTVRLRILCSFSCLNFGRFIARIVIFSRIFFSNHGFNRPEGPVVTHLNSPIYCSWARGSKRTCLLFISTIPLWLECWIDRPACSSGAR